MWMFCICFVCLWQINYYLNIFSVSIFIYPPLSVRTAVPGNMLLSWWIAMEIMWTRKNVVPRGKRVEWTRATLFVRPEGVVHAVTLIPNVTFKACRWRCCWRKKSWLTNVVAATKMMKCELLRNRSRYQVSGEPREINVAQFNFPI